MENNNTNKINIEGPIQNLLSAIFQVKSELGSTIVAGGKNPYFGNDFIQFDTLVKKIDPICNKYGVGIMQFPTGVGLVTLIFHQESGEYITSYYELKLDQETSQGVGSAISYAKRQILQACFLLSAGAEDPSDDDAQLATSEEKSFEKDNPVQGKVDNKTAFDIARVALKDINSLEALQIWKEKQPPIIRQNRKVGELFKAKEAELKMAA